MKRKKARRIVGCLIVIIGLLAVNYPLLAGMISDLFSYREIQGYKNEIVAVDENELSQMLETAREYNNALSSGGNLSTFRDFSLLQPGALLGYVEIPQINAFITVRYSTENEVLVQCLGLVEGTSLPVGGTSSHAVISGHAGMASKKMLTDLTQVKTGDVFFLNMLGQDMAYQVDQIVVVEPWDESELKIIDGEDYVTLLTCTPYGVNDHRLLVRGKRIDYNFEDSNSGVQNNLGRRYSTVELVQFAVMALSIIISLGMLLFWVISRKKKERHDKD